MKQLFYYFLFCLVCFGEQEYYINGLTGEVTDERIPEDVPDVGFAPTHIIPENLDLFDAVRHTIQKSYENKIKELEETIEQLKSDNSKQCSTFVNGWVYVDSMGWVYTTPLIYPYFYRVQSSSWYYHNNSIKDQIIIYSYKDREWQSLFK